MNVTDAKLVKYERTRSINFKKLFKDGHYKKTIFVSPYLYRRCQLCKNYNNATALLFLRRVAFNHCSCGVIKRHYYSSDRFSL